MATKPTNQRAKHQRHKRKPAGAAVPVELAKLKVNGELGLKASIRRLQEAERLAHAAYLAAMETGVDVFNKQNDWTRLVEQLRKTEKDIGEISRDRAETLPVQDVEREWSRMVRMLLAMVEARDRAVVDIIVGMDKPGMTEVLTKKRKDLFQQIASRQWQDTDTQET